MRDPQELIDLLELPAGLIADALSAAGSFGLRVPRGYVARMTKGNPYDPLLLQVLPGAAELIDSPGYGHDPVGDLSAMPTNGLLHKYQGRALVITTGACAIHCRYCFRRHFPYSDAQASDSQWQGILDYLASDNSISEVILSGGDPLTLSDQRLERIYQTLATLPHLQRIRIHTRLPVVLPSRITDSLIELFAGNRFQSVMVIHANHAQEFDDTVGHSLAKLFGAGVTLLNQTVLLRGINDSADALAGLSETLFRHRVLPYYLHLLDKVQGGAHFDVNEAEARALTAQLRARLPGYLLPRLVREQAGAPYKLPVEY